MYSSWASLNSLWNSSKLKLTPAVWRAHILVEMVFQASSLRRREGAVTVAPTEALTMPEQTGCAPTSSQAVFSSKTLDFWPAVKAVQKLTVSRAWRARYSGLMMPASRMISPSRGERTGTTGLLKVTEEATFLKASRIGST